MTNGVRQRLHLSDGALFQLKIEFDVYSTI